MNRKIGLILTLSLALALSACAKKEKPVVEAPPVDTTSGQAVDNNAFGTGLSAEDLARLGIMGNPLNYKTLYFEYNSSAIDQRSEIIAAAHARELNRRGGAKVSLEGHADERGSRDYNLALGERRAQSVANLMNSIGAGGSTIQNISYGEERPVDQAHNEAAWQKNRRVEISY